MARSANTVDAVVLGTLKSMLGPHRGRQPPGADYDSLGYGLFEPFVLKLTKP